MKRLLPLFIFMPFFTFATERCRPGNRPEAPLLNTFSKIWTYECYDNIEDKTIYLSGSYLNELPRATRMDNRVRSAELLFGVKEYYDGDARYSCLVPVNDYYDYITLERVKYQNPFIVKK